MANNLILLWLAALPLMGSPGPATLTLAAIGATFGPRRGLSYLAGIISGTSGVLILIATGITGLILSEPLAVRAITIVAAAYILYLAYRIATAPVLKESNPAKGVPSVCAGFLLAITNPKAFAAIGAAYTSHTVVEHDVMLDAASKVGALLLVILGVNSAWLLVGSTLSSLLRDPGFGRIVNVLFALLLIGSVALALIGI
jgi:threonine/homoserine/homoserine lactone efflux protein